ncbi:MAG: helix-turn-helix transcriptional regulator [Bacilli bacterium]|nr:helix-turn-helix transcriptional regulator [Bacilli bacterium]
MDMNKIGRFIFKLRKEKGLSQTGLAVLIPVTRQAVSSWELGKSLPDSQTLIILGEIFEVSINDLLAGERLPNEIKTEDPNSKVALSLVDEIILKGRVIKARTLFFVCIVLTLIAGFFIYYFVTSYNSIKVYKVQGENENFKTYNGIIISTKQKIYIRLGELIKVNKDNNIDSVKLYFKNKNNQEKVLYRDSKTDILITSNYGYNEGFTSDELKYIINNLYLEVNYKDKSNRMKLTVKKDFSNNLIFYNREKDLLENNKSTITTPLIYDKIKLSMENKGTKQDESYKLVVENDNENINIELQDRKLLIEVTTNDYKENLHCFFSNEVSIKYNRIDNNVQTENKLFTINNEKILTKSEEEIYDKLTNYVNKYILNTD